MASTSLSGAPLVPGSSGPVLSAPLVPLSAPVSSTVPPVSARSARLSLDSVLDTIHSAVQAGIASALPPLLQAPSSVPAPVASVLPPTSVSSVSASGMVVLLMFVTL